MVSRDYTQEVGLSSGQNTISKPIAAIVLLVLAIGGAYLVRSHWPTHAQHTGAQGSAAATAK